MADRLLGAVVLVALWVTMAYFAFGNAQRKNELPAGVDSFGEFLPAALKAHPIAAGIAILAAISFGIYGALVMASVFAWTWFVPARMKRVKFASVKELAKLADEEAQEWLMSLGRTHAERLPAIEELFTERSKTISVYHHGKWQFLDANQRWADAYYAGRVSRNIAAMDAREREFLRIAEILNSAAEGKEPKYRAWRFGLVWAQGKGNGGPAQWHLGENQADAKTPRQAIDIAIERMDLTVESIVSHMMGHRDELKGLPNLPKGLEDWVNGTGVLTGNGSAWLRPADIGKTVFAPQSDYVLHIGTFADGTPLTFSGEGSIVTIAPPGSGKTQCNVFPNLLAWKGPAVVLDISGDIYDNTSKWRAENVGPVYKFSPLEPELSHHYNPLAFVRSEPEFIWEDARLLAEMMIVPSGGGADPFWENEARTVLTAAIACVCLNNPPESRPMHDVLDVMFGGEAWENMIIALKTAVEVRVMQQQGTALSEMPEKTRASVLQTARSSLNAWTGERIARVTDRSDWSPEDLRGGKNPTIYIVVPPNAVESYLSLLRVFIGQHIRMLTGGKVPPRGSPPILIMLDELPRLKEMPPVDEALNIGRKYGLRLWMFAQSVGQLQNAYRNADGMLGSCYVRIFMNPSGADGLADRLSEEIGYVDGLDGSRKKLVEATELSGPNYREQQIVLGLGARPAKVRKDLAWQNAELKARMGSV